MKSIVFIPGYKGSSLLNTQNGNKVWLSLPRILGLAGGLELPIVEYHGIQSTQPAIQASGIIDEND